MYKKLLSSVLALALIGTVSGCGAGPEEKEEESLKTVQALSVTRGRFISQAEVFGSLEPFSEATLAAQVSGHVEELFAQKGDIVTIHQKLINFGARDNSIRLDYQNALQNVENIRNTMRLTKNSALRDEENARIAVEQAQINLNIAIVGDEKTQESLESQIESSKQSIKVAEANLEISENTLDNIKNNNEKREVNLGEISENVTKNTLILLKDIIIFTDETIGVAPENRARRSSYGNFLSFYTPNLIFEAENQWRVLNKRVEDLEKEVETVEWSNLAMSSSTLEKTKEISGDIRNFLDLFQEVLVNTIVGGGMTEALLESLKTETSTYQNTLETYISNVTSAHQNVSDFLINAPQEEKNAELSFVAAQSQLSQAEQNLRQLEASAEVQKVDVGSQKEITQKSLESAQKSLENTKEKNALQIQSVQTELDAAENRLAQASLQLEKLSIESPLSGVITTQNVEAGDTVSIGSPLLSVADIDTLLLKGEVSPDQVYTLRKNQKARVVIDGFGETKGVLTQIFPTANASTRRVEVEISIQNPGYKIPANVFATAYLEIPISQDIIMIPFESLIRQDPAEVFVLTGESDHEKNDEIITFPSPGKDIQQHTGNKAIVERRTVELGRKEGKYVEVKSGLSEGEKIVAERVIDLKEGESVMIATGPAPKIGDILENLETVADE